MKALIVYDSQYGNTEQIAKGIADGLAKNCDVVLKKAADVGPGDIDGIALLLVGSPTQGSKPTVPIREFLQKLPADGLKGIRAAAFDTRMTNPFIRMFGFAAPKIDKTMAEKGAVSAAKPEGFWVVSGKGPLKDFEITRAAHWAETVAIIK
jgi:flavodoxin